LNKLRVLLPVYNAQQTLEASVSEILEVLAEWTGHVELCVLDDGSTDETAEVAHEVAARYPQVASIRHPVRLGLAEAIQTAFDHAPGDIALVGDEQYSLDADDLRTLWRVREIERRGVERDGVERHGIERHRAVDARPKSSIEEGWLEKLQASKPLCSQARRRRGLEIIRRASFEQFRLEHAAQRIGRIDLDNRGLSSGPVLRPNFLGRGKRFSWHE
jgi:glycosyltransferase involved in cell wall biosynthesis